MGSAVRARPRRRARACRSTPYVAPPTPALLPLYSARCLTPRTPTQTVAGSDHKEHAHGEHEPRLHTSQAHKDGHPPAPPTARDPAAVEPKASPASRKSSSHKHGSHHSRHSHKDKRHSVRTPKRADDAPAAPTAAPAAAPAPLPERSVAASPSPSPAAPASAPALSSVAPPSSGRRQIADASPPVSVFVVSECSLYALRLYLYLAEKGRNYIEAPVPEPEWCALPLHVT